MPDDKCCDCGCNLDTEEHTIICINHPHWREEFENYDVFSDPEFKADCEADQIEYELLSWPK
jgi:hypothetical protein